QAHAVSTPGVLERECLREPLDPALDQTDALPAPADADEPQAAAPRRRHDDIGRLVISRDHRRAARLDQMLKQAELGGKISLERRMVIEMIATEIGESAGRDAHAVEAALIKSVRGGFDGGVRHAFARELIERAVQRNRIRSGERAVDLALGRDEPNRADAGTRMTEPGPDLARERSD